MIEDYGGGPIMCRYPGLLTYDLRWSQGALNVPSTSPLNMSMLAKHRVLSGRLCLYFVSMLPAELQLLATLA